MTRANLINLLSEKYPKLTLKEAELAVKTILDGMAASLCAGERIEIRGFSSFTINYRPPRKGRNPKSGVAISVPAKYVPHFKPGKEMRERVDESAI